MASITSASAEFNECTKGLWQKVLRGEPISNADLEKLRGLEGTCQVVPSSDEGAEAYQRLRDAGKLVMEIPMGDGRAGLKAKYKSGKAVGLRVVLEKHCRAIKISEDAGEGDIVYEICDMIPGTGPGECTKGVHLTAEKHKLPKGQVLAVGVPKSSSTVKNTTTFSKPLLPVSELPTEADDASLAPLETVLSTLTSFQVSAAVLCHFLVSYPGKELMMEWLGIAPLAVQPTALLPPGTPTVEVTQAPGVQGMFRDHASLTTPRSATSSRSTSSTGTRKRPPLRRMAVPSVLDQEVAEESDPEQSASETSSIDSCQGLSRPELKIKYQSMKEDYAEVLARLEDAEANLQDVNDELDDTKGAVEDLQDTVEKLANETRAALKNLAKDRSSRRSGLSPREKELMVDDTKTYVVEELTSRGGRWLHELCMTMATDPTLRATLLSALASDPSFEMVLKTALQRDRVGGEFTDAVTGTFRGREFEAAVASAVSRTPGLAWTADVDAKNYLKPSDLPSDFLSGWTQLMKDMNASDGLVHGALDRLCACESRVNAAGVSVGNVTYTGPASLHHVASQVAGRVKTPESLIYDFRTYMGVLLFSHGQETEQLNRMVAAARAGIESPEAAATKISFNVKYPEAIFKVTNLTQVSWSAGLKTLALYIGSNSEGSLHETMIAACTALRDQVTSLIDTFFPTGDASCAETAAVLKWINSCGYEQATGFLNSLRPFSDLMTTAGIDEETAWSKVCIYAKGVFDRVAMVRTISKDPSSVGAAPGANKIYGAMRASQLLGEYKKLDWIRHPDVGASLSLATLQREAATAKELKAMKSDMQTMKNSLKNQKKKE